MVSHTKKKPEAHQGGFTLVVALMLMMLLVVIAVGLLGLSAIELRSSSALQNQANARANARLALMQAINQLQMEMGPDQRVSAPSSLIPDASQKHWVGVWSSRLADGSPVWSRDTSSGSLLDVRSGASWAAPNEVKSWLVSGNGDPAQSPANGVRLVGPGSAGARPSDFVDVPLVKIESRPSSRGRMAWWTGDLGQRANLSVADAHGGHSPNAASPGDGGYFRMLASQQSESAVMTGGKPMTAEIRKKLASAETVELGGNAGWTNSRFHDFTTFSAGVLADVRDGGLKRDLTPYVSGDGTIEAVNGMEGISDETPMIAEVKTSRFGLSAPRFGLLRDWVRSSPGFAGKNVPGRLPQTDLTGGARSKELALCNESPVRIKGAEQTNLQPILVEASSMMQVSVFMDRMQKSAGGVEVPMFQWRQHHYPRVVLWNPYNVELKMKPMMVMIQGNGRQEVWSEDMVYDKSGKETGAIKKSQWLFFEGGRSTSFGGSITQTEGYNDPYIGSFFYSVPETAFGPGECLVFSPKRSAEYDGRSVYHPGAYDLSKNELSCEVAPNESRSYYISQAEINGGTPNRPVRYWFDATSLWNTKGIENQSDDTRVVLKAITGSGPVTFESFDTLPQIAYVSSSIQYGAGREPRIAWNSNDPMPVEFLDKTQPQPKVEPNVRTRDGIRMRWFDETLSNKINSGALSSSPQYFEEAALANWNPRASYAVRCPWENLGGSLPATGSAGGPWFFGIYTRDLYDQAVSWTGQIPVFSKGRSHGNPFGPPQEGKDRYTVFELPRTETGVLSLGQFQNAKISEFVWHPSFAIGNSLADPRLGVDQLIRTVPPSATGTEEKLGGFYRTSIGWSKDSQRAKGRDEWSDTARAMLQGLPDSDLVVYDLSYEVNHALWDRYFLSTGDSSAKSAFLQDPDARPLPNGRLKPAAGVPLPKSASDLGNFHRAAYHLTVDGAFNVNSTSVEAWKALLGSSRGVMKDGSPFARLLNPSNDPFSEGSDADSNEAWSCMRSLSDSEITLLATAIVEEVKLRGPFLSLSDFVNRRLRADETGKRGALQAAIDRAGINSAFEQAQPLNNKSALPDYKHPDNIRDATRLDQTLKPATQAWGAPGFLTQGDVLQLIGPALSARSDSFLVRSYGESLGADGKVLARAWCEAVVQRTPVPVTPDGSGLNPEKSGQTGDFGRRFSVLSFRWLQPDEI